MLILWIIIPLFILYGRLVLYCWKNWRSVPEYKCTNQKHSTRVSVIIPARNEAENIGKLLATLERQSYPATFFEIIVVDDHSTDSTADIVRQYPRVKLITLEENAINSYKKKAVEAGIAAATGEWIVTTDADCQPPPRWLETLVEFREEKAAVFIAAPVNMRGNHSLLHRFQEMDFMILQAITGAVVQQRKLSMCNGANIAYSRNAFQEVGGFSGIDRIASGDDMLLMHKIAGRFPAGIHYLKSKEAIVDTLPMPTWKTFFQQRIRWASKARFYTDRRLLPVLALVYLFNLSFPVLLIAGLFCYYFWICAAAFWILKTLAEWPLCTAAAAFFGKKNIFYRFFLFQPLHIIYTLATGFFGQLGRYEWKGRRVR